MLSSYIHTHSASDKHWMKIITLCSHTHIHIYISLCRHVEVMNIHESSGGSRRPSLCLVFPAISSRWPAALSLSRMLTCPPPSCTAQVTDDMHTQCRAASASGHLVLWPRHRTDTPGLHSLHGEVLSRGEGGAAVGGAAGPASAVTRVKLSTQPHATVLQLAAHALQGKEASTHPHHG